MKVKRDLKMAKSLLRMIAEHQCPYCGKKMMTARGEYDDVDCIEYGDIAFVCVNHKCKVYGQKRFLNIDVMTAAEHLLLRYL